MATLAEPIVHGKPVESGLKTNTLTLFDTTVIATSSVAPAYTLAATAAFLVAAVGLASPCRDPGGIPPRALHRDCVLLPEPAGSELRRVVLVGEPDPQPLHRLGIGLDPARSQCPLLRCGAAHCRRVHAPAPQQLWLDQLGCGKRQPADRGGRRAVAAARDLHGGTRHSSHRELSVDPRVHRILDRAGFCDLGDRQDRRRPPRSQRGIRPVVQPAAVARPQRSRDGFRAGSVLLLGLGHRGQRERGVQGRE